MSQETLPTTSLTAQAAEPAVAPASPVAGNRLTWTAPGLWAMVFIHVGALLALLPQARPTAGVIALAVVLFAVRNFCVMAGFHRYFAHASFRTSRAFQFVLAFVGGMGVMRSALWWASQHRKHHKCSDEAEDPHSPNEGYLWSHMTWFMAERNQETRHEMIPDLERYPELVWLDRHEWIPVLALVALTYAIGGFAGWVWGANVSTLVLCHSTFSINSVSHLLGYRRYETTDDSRNNPVVALFTFGEGWHNNHHHIPWRASQGEPGTWEVDLAYLGIRALEALGIVWNVKR